MHKNATEFPEPGFGGLIVGRTLGPLELTIGADANERFWLAVGITPRPVLYPPIAAQLAIMLTRAAIAPVEVLHAGQWLQAHATAAAGTPLTTSGTVVERYDKRGREYVVVETVTTTVDSAVGDRAVGDRAVGDRAVGDRAVGGRPLWTGRSTFCALGPRARA